jgi:hypothetical protein
VLELEGKGNHDLRRIYEESQKLQGFVMLCNKFGGFLGEVQEIDVDNNERMLSLVKYLTRLIDSHMLQSSKSAP